MDRYRYAALLTLAFAVAMAPGMAYAQMEDAPDKMTGTVQGAGLQAHELRRKRVRAQ